MQGIGSEFREWVLSQRPAGVTPTTDGDDRIRVTTDAATAEVNLYPYEDGREICELRIERTADGEAAFFLHFMLDDLDRAKELFAEMVEVLEGESDRGETRVLLCCTSALTTTFFANKMNEVAQGLSLGYSFSALSYQRALSQEGDGHAAILLAPQVAHLRGQMSDAHPGTPVFEIPARVFGSYDAPGAVRLLMHVLRDGRTGSEDDDAIRVVRGTGDGHRILVITLFALRNGARLGWRLYERGRAVSEGAVRKPQVNFRDIEDLLETSGMRGVDVGSLDAVGIAVPGVTNKGVVRLPGLDEGGFDLGPHLTQRFGVPAYVDNNCNAAAVACYVSQNEHESVTFFRQEFGHEAGGLGTVVHGRLLRGRLHLAGEPKHFERRFAYTSPGGYDEARWTADGLFEIAANVTLTCVSLTAPDAVYLAVDTVDDMEALHAELAREIGDEFVPALYAVDDYVERVYLGEMALCAQRLDAAAQ